MTKDLRHKKELGFVEQSFTKDISPSTISSWIMKTVILCCELVDQEILMLYQGLLCFQGIPRRSPLEQILLACQWKSDNSFTQFYFKGVAWADLELHHLGQVGAAQQIRN